MDRKTQWGVVLGAAIGFVLTTFVTGFIARAGEDFYEAAKEAAPGLVNKAQAVASAAVNFAVEPVELPRLMLWIVGLAAGAFAGLVRGLTKDRKRRQRMNAPIRAPVDVEVHTDLQPVALSILNLLAQRPHEWHSVNVVTRAAAEIATAIQSDAALEWLTAKGLADRAFSQRLNLPIYRLSRLGRDTLLMADRRRDERAADGATEDAASKPDA